MVVEMIAVAVYEMFLDWRSLREQDFGHRVCFAKRGRVFLCVFLGAVIYVIINDDNHRFFAPEKCA